MLLVCFYVIPVSWTALKFTLRSKKNCWLNFFFFLVITHFLTHFEVYEISSHSTHFTSFIPPFSLSLGWAMNEHHPSPSVFHKNIFFIHSMCFAYRNALIIAIPALLMWHSKVKGLEKWKAKMHKNYFRTALIGFHVGFDGSVRIQRDTSAEQILNDNIISTFDFPCF